MKMLLRRMFPCPPVARWRAFESILTDCLEELQHEIVTMDLDPYLPPDPPGFGFHIYCHKNRWEVPCGDLFYKEMHMRGLFTIDQHGWGIDHSGVRSAPDLRAVDTDQARTFCQTMRSEFFYSGQSKHRQPPMRTIDPAVKPYYLVPLQLPTDDVIMYHSPLTVEHFVHQLADWAAAARRNVVFKLHPGSEAPRIADAVRRRITEKHVFLLGENIHSLVAESTGVIVINSGVGFESLIHGKPVVTLGSCDYQWATYRGTSRNLDAAADYVESYTAELQLRGFRFIHFYYHQHAYLVLPEVTPDVRSRLTEFLRAALNGLSSETQSAGQTPGTRSSIA